MSKSNRLYTGCQDRIDCTYGCQDRIHCTQDVKIE